MFSDLIGKNFPGLHGRSNEFIEEIQKELIKGVKSFLDLTTKANFDFVMTNEEFDKFLEKISENAPFLMKGDDELFKKLILEVKEERNKYGLCTKKPMQVEFREVRENESFIATLEGNLYCNRDKHFIIKGVNGEEYPIEKDIFYRTYEVDKPCSSVE